MTYAHTYQQAADLINTSKSTIERLVAKGEIPVVEILGNRRIFDEDLKEFLKSNRRVADSDKCPTENTTLKTGISHGARTASSARDLAKLAISGKLNASKTS